MRKLAIWIIAFMILIVANSCDGQTATPTVDPVPSQPMTPIQLPLSLVKTPEPTVMEFLIDNSESVENRCGNIGGEQFNLANQIFNVFRTIDPSLMKNLYIGVSRFGNKSSNFLRVVQPLPFDPSFPEIESAPNDIGQQYQNFSDAIQQSVNEIKDIPFSKKQLIVFTDGKFSFETAENVQTKLQDATNSYGIQVTVGLICSTSDESVWKSFANSNGNITVLDIEDAVGKLLEQDLKDYLPGGISITASKYQSDFSVPGYYTSMSIMYWNPDDKNPSLFITDKTIGQPIQINEGLGIRSMLISPVKDCVNHQISIPNPGGNWLLFFRPHTFDDFQVEVTAPYSESGLIELVNNSMLELNFAISNSEFTGDYLQKWSDCFYLDLLDQNGYRGNNFFVTPVPNSENKLFWKAQSDTSLHSTLKLIPPQFYLPTDFNIEIIIETLDKSLGPIWTGNLSIPARFRVDTVYGEYLTPSVPEAIEWNLTLNNAGSNPEVYLVTSLNDPSSLDPFPGPLPNLTHNIEGMNAIQVLFDNTCQITTDVPGEKYICAVRDVSNTSIYQSYRFSVYDYIVSDYRFDQLFLIWKDGPSQKAITWLCPIDKELNGVMITCNTTNEPAIEQK